MEKVEKSSKSERTPEKGIQSMIRQIIALMELQNAEIPTDYKSEEFQFILGNPKLLKEEIRGIYYKYKIMFPYKEVLLQWKYFYKKYFEVKLDISSIGFYYAHPEDERKVPLVFVDIELEKILKAYEAQSITVNLEYGDMAYLKGFKSKRADRSIYFEFISDILISPATSVLKTEIQTSTLIEELLYGLFFFEQHAKLPEVVKPILCLDSHHEDRQFLSVLYKNSSSSNSTVTINMVEPALGDTFSKLKLLIREMHTSMYRPYKKFNRR